MHLLGYFVILAYYDASMSKSKPKSSSIHKSECFGDGLKSTIYNLVHFLLIFWHFFITPWLPNVVNHPFPFSDYRTVLLAKMSDKLGTKYAQNARFVGRKSVSGPLNDLSLAHIVTDLQSEARKSNPAEELRCNLEFSDKHLLITYIKKDEGFESDGESTKSNEVRVV